MAVTFTGSDVATIITSLGIGQAITALVQHWISKKTEKNINTYNEKITKESATEVKEAINVAAATGTFKAIDTSIFKDNPK